MADSKLSLIEIPGSRGPELYSVERDAAMALLKALEIMDVSHVDVKVEANSERVGLTFKRLCPLSEGFVSGWLSALGFMKAAVKVKAGEAREG